MPRKLLKVLAALAVALPSALGALPYRVQASLDRPWLDAGRAQTVILRVDLDGLDLPRRSRPPLNIALVVDRSGSMAGDKIEAARRAAREVVGRLRPDDIFSLVSFDDHVTVHQSARRLGDRRAALEAIDGLRPGGSTALYAGVETALRQAREYAGRKFTSRVILISDGLANVGPDKPADARRLGREAARRGIPVTTLGLGLGYDEDLLTALSSASDGNHAFIRDSSDLAQVLDRELGDALAVVVRGLTLEIRLADGVRYRRSLDRELDVDGSTLRLDLGQLSSGQRKQLLLELEAPAGKAGSAAQLASLSVRGQDAEGRSLEPGRESVELRYTDDEAKARSSEDAGVSADAAKARANAAREQAVQLRDEGKAAEAAGLLKRSAEDLRRAAAAAPAAQAPAYHDFSSRLDQEADAVSGSGADWNETRKALKAESYKTRQGQSY